MDHRFKASGEYKIEVLPTTWSGEPRDFLLGASVYASSVEEFMRFYKEALTEIDWSVGLT